MSYAISAIHRHSRVLKIQRELEEAALVQKEVHVGWGEWPASTSQRFVAGFLPSTPLIELVSEEVPAP